MKTPKKGEVIHLGTPPSYIVDRCALIVWAKEPFLDWLNQLPDNEPGHSYTLAQVNDEPCLYLLPPYSFDDEKEELLALVKPTVFAKQLEGWCTNPDWWPRIPFDKEFDAWFEYEMPSLVLDLVDSPIDRDIS